MARRRVHTGRIGGNQQRIDELEYFVEGIGRFLFGDEGEDFRLIREYVASTRNLSGLLDLGKRDGAAVDVAEDLQFLYAELEGRSGRPGSAATPTLDDRTAAFRYTLYLDLLANPERLIEAVEPERRMEIATMLSRGNARFAPLISRVNVYAWLSTVGLPDLAAELGTDEPARILLVDEHPAAIRGLSRIFVAQRPPVGRGLSQYLKTAYAQLSADYRAQLARFAVRTQPL